MHVSFPAGSVVKNLPVSAGNTGDEGLIPGLGISPGGGNGNPLQYFCLENFVDREAWWATVHGVAKSWTQLSELIYNVLVSDVQQNDLKSSSIIGYYKIPGLP